MFQRLVNNLSEWSQQTFGTDAERGPVGPLKHLQEEVEEALAAPNDVMEYADCFILILDAARRAGFNHEKLITASLEKIEICKTRKWPKPNSNESVHHLDKDKL